MRVIVVLVVGASIALSGCSCPPRKGHLQAVPARCLSSAQSQPKLAKASVAKVVPKPSRTASKRSKKFKTHLAKAPRLPIKAPASAEMERPLPPRKPELAPATDAESSPPLPTRKAEQRSDSREHAVPETKFMAAKAKAQREGVHSLTGEDIRGLTQEQIKALRGY